MSAPSPLILPVESRVRELDAKLLLAGVAAERGFPVVLGERPRVSFALPRLPRGIFFAKSMRFTSDLMTGFIRGFGHHLVASDEESLVRFDHPDYCSWRYSEHTFVALRHLFAWGEDDAEFLRGYQGRRAVEIHATGNPRMDLLREDAREVFRPKAEALRRRYRKFILINTNFPFVNNFVPSLNLIQSSGSSDSVVSRTGRGMSPAFALSMARHVGRLADAFAALLPDLSRAFPGEAIVLRPHPSEDHDHWRRAAADLANVHVVHEDNVIPWLMACEVLLHNGCTTAVEASVLGTPAVTYQPVINDHHDYHLPNGLSIRTRSADEVVSTIRSILAAGVPRVDAEHRQRLLTRHLTICPERLAADRIVDVLESCGYLREAPPRPARADYGRAWLGTHARTLIKHVNMRRKEHRNGAAYLRHRFPELDVAEVNSRLIDLGRALGRFDGLRAESIGTNLFAIRPHGGPRPSCV